MGLQKAVAFGRKNSSDVINRVYYQEQSFLLTRGGKVVARLTGAREAMRALNLCSYGIDDRNLIRKMQICGLTSLLACRV
jgi:antitoxin (DNA-binding transcriptional repressor) of toxin-antitoxin stability system